MDVLFISNIFFCLFHMSSILFFFSSNSQTKLINRIIFLKGKYRNQQHCQQATTTNQEKFKTQRHKQVKYGEKANKKLHTNANSKFQQQ